MRKMSKLLCLCMLLTLMAALLSSCGSGGKDVEKYSIDMGDFVTNIKNSKQLLNCSVKIDITVQSMVQTITDKDYIAKDAILRILRAQDEAAIQDPAAQDNLAATIKDALAEAFDTDCIHMVYFYRFAYQ